MALEATKAEVWAVGIDDRTGGVADRLEPFAEAGASFEMTYRDSLLGVAENWRIGGVITRQPSTSPLWRCLSRLGLVRHLHHSAVPAARHEAHCDVDS